ncbi:MAG: hypothetical protein ACK4GL_12830 [Flavobacteriales bacterium]
MINKTKVKEQLDLLPDEFSAEELIEKLLLMEKIEHGLKQSENKETLGENQLDEEVKSWFK